MLPQRASAIHIRVLKLSGADSAQVETLWLEKFAKRIAIGHAGIWDLSWEELAVREALRRSRKPARTPTLVSEDDGRMVREENA